jgi:DNA-binding NarL/FixJ family response regulator
MNPTQIRIILVDDHELVRKSWKILLENNPRFTVIADCDTGFDAIKLTQELVPDILLVDINMSPLSGFAVTERLVATTPAVKIIGLSVSDQPKYATRMLELGAWGYLTKTSSLEEINQGILEVYNGEHYICEEVAKNMPHS